jgi:hypothetical protein
MRNWPKVGEIRRRYDRGKKEDAIYYRLIKYNYNRPSIYEDGVYRTATVKYLYIGKFSYAGEKDDDFMIFGEMFRPNAFMLDEKVSEDELDSLMIELL